MMKIIDLCKGSIFIEVIKKSVGIIIGGFILYIVVNNIVLDLLIKADVVSNEIFIAKLFEKYMTEYWFWLIVSYVLMYLWNKKQVLNKKGNYDNSYIIFYYLARLLGFNTINLINISIPNQFIIVAHSIFNHFDTDATYTIKTGEKLSTKFINEKSEKSKINLIISDTYKINLDMIPREKNDYYTLYITYSNKTEGSRIKNEDFGNFINGVLTKLNEFEPDVYIYATTNPYSSYSIANSCFKKGTRSYLGDIYIYQFNSEILKFEKHKKI